MSTFDATLDKAQQRLAELQRRLTDGTVADAFHAGNGASRAVRENVLLSVVEEALEELDSTLEELRSDERLQEQNEALRVAQGQLVAERERYAELFEHAPDAYLVTDARGIIREANFTAAYLLGVRPQYLVGKPLINYVSLEERAQVRQQLIRLEGDGTEIHQADQIRVMPPHGDVFDAALRFVGVRDTRTQSLVEVRWLLRDVSESTRAASAYYQLLVDSIEDFAIYLMDDDLHIMSWNRGAEHLFGYTTAEAIGRRCPQLLTPEDRALGASEKERETAIQNGRAPQEHWILRKDGTRLFASGVLTLLPGSDTRRRFVKVLRDITDRKREEEVLQRERDTLEDHVRERTAELASASANAALQAEMVERKRAEENREVLRRQWVHSLEQERRRISRELHDEMGQHLTAFSLNIKALETICVTEDPAPAAILRQLHEQVGSLSREMHRLAVELRPTTLDDMGLVVALRSQVETWSARTGVAAQFDVSGMDRLRLPGDVETALYRIAQEALNNIAKHARAKNVTVMLYRNAAPPVVLMIEDDGVGFDTGENENDTPTETQVSIPLTTGGLGLIGIRERVSFIGGTVMIESAPGRGTTVLVRVSLPLPLNDQDAPPSERKSFDADHSP